jgi:hypothetical protein
MFPQNLSGRHDTLAVPDLVRILLSHNDLVRLGLMAPNIYPLNFSGFWPTGVPVEELFKSRLLT